LPRSAGKAPKKDIDERVQAAACILGLQDFLARRPHELSGGQRQRVAMGRAIVRNPKVFLFDEPLSKIDAKLRTQMRIEIKRLHQKVQSTIISVTHYQVEAMTLADRIVVMRDGYLEQVGAPLEVFRKPGNTFVAGFIGSPLMNLVPARVSAGLTMEFEGGLRLPLPDRAGMQVRADMDVIVGLRTEDITVVDGREEFPAEWKAEGIVEVVEPLGSETNLHLDLSGTKLVARCEGGRTIKAGDRVPLAMNLNHLHVFDAASKRSIY
jgi:multiple sugar transport system ATP-binding protein